MTRRMHSGLRTLLALHCKDNLGLVEGHQRAGVLVRRPRVGRPHHNAVSRLQPLADRHRIARINVAGARRRRGRDPFRRLLARNLGRLGGALLRRRDGRLEARDPRVDPGVARLAEAFGASARREARRASGNGQNGPQWSARVGPAPGTEEPTPRPVRKEVCSS
ncbi:predicted protein [Verticillium alfalfae VaMs.102]|uniref:Predicted protein n=1 Tax=Verticillium alfalfae (strain VaMs.102 / ATCC MYA-4576 / FGSC 10136) TaxID=526221 RepID=C9S5P6_VERA1|nr:predicted protein [Verticillium alfalfae VaMs.102]EEY14272.1 predicted protein [Verticillium alfalfae VaMs.102]